MGAGRGRIADMGSPSASRARTKRFLGEHLCSLEGVRQDRISSHSRPVGFGLDIAIARDLAEDPNLKEAINFQFLLYFPSRVNRASASTMFVLSARRWRRQEHVVPSLGVADRAKQTRKSISPQMNPHRADEGRARNSE